MRFSLLLRLGEAVVHIRSLRIALIALLVAIKPSEAGEILPGPTGTQHNDQCKADNPCELQGRLHILAPGFPGSGARILTQAGCVALLLPPEYFDAGATWDGQS